MVGAGVKDVAIAVAVVGGVLLILFAYTGVWPPMVVVESGSMMHPPCGETRGSACAGFGKFGTIDPGDMVFVKRVSSNSEVETLADGRDVRYGLAGDVLIYYRDNARSGRFATPIIHRAVAYIEVTGADVPDDVADNPPVGFSCRDSHVANARYAWKWRGQQFSTTGLQGVVIPEIGLGSPSAPYKPCWSGYITKGDNPVTNRPPDQMPSCITPSCQPIRLAWIEGKAVGEVPWFGLIKLALSGSPNYRCPGQLGDPACVNAVAVGNAYAPGDLWVMLGVSLGLLVAVPVGFDMAMNRIRQRREGERPAAKDGDEALERTHVDHGPGIGSPPSEAGEPPEPFWRRFWPREPREPPPEFDSEDRPPGR